MPPRPGATEKVSISLRSEDLAILRRRAKRLYDGNLSAVIAELAADAALLEGMQNLLEELGGAILTDRDRTELEAEWAGQSTSPRRATPAGRAKRRARK